MQVTTSELADPKRASELLNIGLQAITENPYNVNGYITVASCYYHLDDFENAIRYADIAIGLEPRNGSCLIIRSAIEGATGNPQKAKTLLEEAVYYNPFAPSLMWNLSLSQLHTGNFLDGWDNYKYRRITVPRSIRCFKPYVEPNTDLSDKTVLIWCDQGFGDMIMFYRFIEEFIEKAKPKKVLLETRENLVTLFQSPNFFTYSGDSAGSLPYPFDYQLPLSDLPYVMGCHSEECHVVDTPYLLISDNLVKNWKGGLSEIKGRRLGIAWKGSSTHVNDKNRSMELDDFMPLNQLGTLIGIQPDLQYEAPEGMNVLNPCHGLHNFEYTGALLKNVDIVVTIDSALAHLAGALNIPTILMLPYANEWRWGNGEGKTFWYPSVTMVKQPKPKDWKSVMETVVKLIENTPLRR